MRAEQRAAEVPPPAPAAAVPSAAAMGCVNPAREFRQRRLARRGFHGIGETQAEIDSLDGRAWRLTLLAARNEVWVSFVAPRVDPVRHLCVERGCT